MKKMWVYGGGYFMKENAKDNLYQIVKFVESQDMEKEIDIKMIVPY